MIRTDKLNRAVVHARMQINASGLTNLAVVNIFGPIAFEMCNCIPVANPIENPIAYDVPMGMFGESDKILILKD